MTIENDVLYSKDWHVPVLEALSKGLSNRETARQVFGNDSYESRIRTFLKRKDVSNYLDWFKFSGNGFSYTNTLPELMKIPSNRGVFSNCDVTPHQSLSLKLEASGKREGVYNKPQSTSNSPKSGLTILYWDLESSLIEGMFFRLWKENIPFNRVTKQSHLLSHSYAFNDGEVVGSRLTPEQVKTGDDFDLVVKMIEAINKADIMVTFNGKKFDTKLLNTRALYWGLPPINYPKHIDLFEQAKRVFKFPSNSMQNISKYLGLDGKIQTSGTQLWERCANWKEYQQCNNALEELMIYGNQDIEATRDLYKQLQGWMKGIPNVSTITNVVESTASLRCIHCGSEDVFKVDQKTYTSTSSFDLYRCNENDCRGLSRVTSNGKNLVGVI